MDYAEIVKTSESLSYRDKLRLAQHLIQVGRKEEEETHPDNRKAEAALQPDPELITYVADRLQKLKPTKKATVLNAIGAMFQFRGAISDEDKEKMFLELVKKGHLKVTETGKVEFPSR
jgi:hypothetical protein